jgi:hypothetical protein
VTISLSPEDEKTLKGLRKDSAYTRLAGGFREYGVGAALKGIGEGAAAGGGNGAAALGVGMGLGGIVAGVGMVPPGAQPGSAGGVPPPAPGGGAAPAGGQGASILCANCHAPNSPGAKFCSNCGSAIAAPQAAHCTQCGTAASPGAKFCGSCGASLAP